ncbi:MAG: hypothetical protein ACTSWY_07415 [Promethearchaeota archaeon]
MSNRLEPELVKLIDEIVTKKVREELEERSKLVTSDQFTQAMERIDKRFEESEQRFTQAMERIDKRFEASELRFESLQERLEKHDIKFDRLINIVENIQQQLGKPFEQFARNIIIRILEGEGITNVELQSKLFIDPEYTVFENNEDIEIDGFSEEPPLIVEITSVLRETKKVTDFLKKKKFLEKKFGVSFRGFFIASSSQLSQELLAQMTILLHQNRCELINL